MALNGVEPDFAARGDLSLKPWIANDQGSRLPAEIAPAGDRRARALRGADRDARAVRSGRWSRARTMKDALRRERDGPDESGHQRAPHSVLDLALQPLEACFALPLVHEIADENDRAMLDIAVAAEMNLVGDPILVAADAARDAGNAPNAVMAAAVAIIGPKRVERALACTRALIDLFAQPGCSTGATTSSTVAASSWTRRRGRCSCVTPRRRHDPRPEAMLAAIEARGGESVFLKYLKGLDGRLSRDAILAAIATTIAWGPLMRKRISRLTAETLPVVPAALRRDDRRDDPRRASPAGNAARHPARRALRAAGRWRELCFLAMTGKKPSAEEALPLQILSGC